MMVIDTNRAGPRRFEAFLAGAAAVIAGIVSILAWAAAGSLLGFGLIGGFSIGFFYLPSCLLLAVAGLMLDRANWGRLPVHLGLMVVGAVAQVVVMFAAIGLLS